MEEEAWHRRTYLEVPLHDCTINHHGTPGARECVAALEMIFKLFNQFHVVGCVSTICLGDNAATPAKLKWSNTDYLKNNNMTTPPVAPMQSGKDDGDLKVCNDNDGKLPRHIPKCGRVNCRIVKV